MKHAIPQAVNHEQVVFQKQANYVTQGIGKIQNEERKDAPDREADRQNSIPGEKPKKSKPKAMEEKVYTLARKSNQVLYTTTTVFPFDFFPDTLTINANKIDVVKSEFFGSHQTTSVPLRDIANVEVQTTPFFASLRIVNIRYPMQPINLQYLKKDDAVKAKQIIDGLMVAMSQGADVAAIEPKRFLREIETVGASAVPQ
jgi:hypothetical protein